MLTGLALVASGVGLGAQPASAEPATPAADPLVVAQQDDVTYRFVEASGSAQGYVLELDREDVPQWRTSSGAVGVTVQGYSTVNAPYEDVTTQGDTRVATASVTVGAGTVVEVSDTYSFSEGTLEIARTFDVTALAAADAGKGISLTFPLADATGKAPGSYKWFSPGTWYGNDSMTFTDRNTMAFDGVETSLPVDAMTAPLVTAWDQSSTYALTLLDRTPGKRETIAADKDPQTSKTLVDARINLASLGLRALSGSGGATELFQTYPGTNTNYRNRYSGKPTAARMVPLSQDLHRETGMALRYGSAATFDDMVTSVWRQAFAESARTVDRVDTKTHFDTMVDYIYNSYGTSGGKRVYSTNYELLQTSSGFLWRQADLASIQLAQGWQRGDEEMKQRARNVINDQITKGGLVSSNPRTHAEAMTAVLNAYLTDREQGTDNPTWLATVRGYGDGLAATPSIWAVPVLLDLASTTGEAGYRTKALAAGQAAYQTQSKDMYFVGSLEDYNGGPSERDREMGLTSLEAYMALYRDSTTAGDRAKWLGAAQLAADYSETWSYVQDLTTNPEDASADLVMYGNDHLPPYGISQIHAGAAGGDVAAAFFVTEYYELWEATGDEHYRDFAVFLEKNSMLYTNMGDKYGQMADSVKGSGLGFTNEYLGTAANDYWNNNQRGDGNRSNIGWATYMLAGMTQKTLDRLGRYTVAEPTVSDINGLNAYYRLVNRATGEALDVSDASRADGAALTTTPVESSTGVSTQQWLLEPQGEEGPGGFKVVNRSTAKVLRPQGDSTSVGAGAVQSIPMPGQHLGYTFSQQADGSYLVTNTASGKVLELNDTDPALPTVQQNTATGSDYQRWYLQPVGDLQILDATASRVLGSTQDGVSRQSFDDNATTAQRWSAVPSLDGYVGLVSRDSGLALSGSGATPSLSAAGAPDVQGFSPAQQWLVTLLPDGYFTLTSREGRSLAVDGDEGVALVDAASDGAARFRVTTAGPATVDSPASAVLSDAVTLTVLQGARAELPDSVTVHHSDGATSTEQVQWDLSGLDTRVAGTHDVTGTLPGTGVPARARVVVVPEGDVTGLHTVHLVTTVGTVPVLPGLVVATTADGREIELPVTWQGVDSSDFAEIGEVTLAGSVTGSTLQASAVITVSETLTPIAAVPVVQVRTQAGQRPVLPQDIDVTFTDGSQGSVPVQWQGVEDTQYASPGYFTVDGTTPGHQGVVRAYVTVAQVLNPFGTGGANCWTPGGDGTWTADGSRLIHGGNTANRSSYAHVCDPVQGGALTLADGIVETTLSLTSTYGNGGLWVRSSGTDNDRDGYYLGVEQHTTNFVAGKQVNGQWSDAIQWAYADTGVKGSESRHLKVVADGSQLSFFVDDMGEPVLTQEDSSFASGTVGVRTWRSGAEVTSFVVRPLTSVVTASDTAVTTSVGTAPALPATISALDSAGDVVSTPVTWETPDPDRYTTPGSFTVRGRLTGLDVTAVVTVEDAAAAATVRVPLTLTRVGVAPVLPATATETLPDGTTRDVAVTWPQLDPSDFAGAGSWVDVGGTVVGSAETVTAHVAVASYSDSFASTGVEGWRTYGGTWSTTGPSLGVKRDTAWGRGEKAVADAAAPDDLVYQANVRVTEGNQAGLLFRVSDPGVGADTYRGYYAGIDTTTGHVILGKADNGWTSIKESGTVPGIAFNQPVQLRVVARGSHIQVFAGDMTTPVIDVEDSSHSSGSIGVRGWNSAYQVSDALVSGVADVVSVEEVTTSVKGSAAPSLPSTVRVTYADGSSGQLPVEWDLTEDLDRTQPEIVITGAVTGSDIPARALVQILGASDITSTMTVSVSTTVGSAPVLPSTVSVTRVEGSVADEDVTWDQIDPARYARSGAFVVTGHLTDHPGVAAHALVYVHEATPDPDEIVEITPVEVETTVGTAPGLPGLVTAVLANGTTREVAVTWDGITAQEYAQPGAFEVHGRVAGTEVRALATVTVVEIPAGTGSIAVEARIDGAAAATAPEQILADVVCTLDGTEVDLGDMTRVPVATGGASVRIDGIPLGARCTVNQQGEVGSFGETRRSSTPEGGTVTVEQSVAGGAEVPAGQRVVLVNTYDWSAGLSLTQVVRGEDGAPGVASANLVGGASWIAIGGGAPGSVDYALSCSTSDGRPVGVGELASFRLTHGQEVHLGGATVPVGTRCTLAARGEDATHTEFGVDPASTVQANSSGILDLVLGEDEVTIVATTTVGAAQPGDDGSPDGSGGENGSGGPSTGAGTGGLAHTGADSVLLITLGLVGMVLTIAGLALLSGRRRITVEGSLR